MGSFRAMQQRRAGGQAREQLLLPLGQGALQPEARSSRIKQAVGMRSALVFTVHLLLWTFVVALRTHFDNSGQQAAIHGHQVAGDE